MRILPLNKIIVLFFYSCSIKKNNVYQWKEVKIEYDQLILDRSDGTVTEWSAKGQYRPDLYSNRQTQACSQGATIIEARGVNHSEFRNHSEITKIFNEQIWSGMYDKDRQNPVFKINSR